ncbi:TPR_REGION domain-containing protein, partial [Haematococcus lacustris]
LTASDLSSYRRRIEAEADHFLDCSSWSALQVAQRMSADGLHLAINLNGYTKGARNEIFALMPAPVQASYMGFPATSGADFLPWIIVDEVVAPPSLHRCYSEPGLVLLPHCYFVNDHKREFGDMLLPREQQAVTPSRAQ